MATSYSFYTPLLQGGVMVVWEDRERDMRQWAPFAQNLYLKMEDGFGIVITAVARETVTSGGDATLCVRGAGGASAMPERAMKACDVRSPEITNYYSTFFRMANGMRGPQSALRRRSGSASRM